MKKISSKLMKKVVLEVLIEGERNWNQLAEKFGGDRFKYIKIFEYGYGWCGGLTRTGVVNFLYTTDIAWIREISGLIGAADAVRLMYKHIDIDYLREVAPQLTKLDWSMLRVREKKFFEKNKEFDKFYFN